MQEWRGKTSFSSERDSCGKLLPNYNIQSGCFSTPLLFLQAFICEATVPEVESFNLASLRLRKTARSPAWCPVLLLLKENREPAENFSSGK